MGKDGLIYTFVARGTGSNLVVLAKYTALEGNYNTIALQCAQKLAAKNHMITYECNHHTFNYQVEDGITYLIIAEKDFGRQIPFACLNRIKEDFRTKHGEEAGADMAVAHSLDNKFRSVLKEHMRYFAQNSENLDKMASIKAEVQDVKNIMMQNIGKIEERGEQLKIVVDKAYALAEDAKTYTTNGKGLRRKMWFANMRLKLLVQMMLVVAALIIYLSICKGFKCK